jgi:putative Mg2+ transporter-C (MgtC) family protein
MLVTSYRWLDSTDPEILRIDPTRMAQGIMTGIGFLGGGVIFKEGLTVRGLTTAASLWTTAAVGILFGIGLYFAASLGTLLTLGILAAFRWVEELIPNRFYAHYVVRFRKDHTPSEAEVRRMLSDQGFKVANMSYALSGDGAVFEYRTVINTAKKANAERLAEHLRAAENVVGFSVSPTGD